MTSLGPNLLPFLRFGLELEEQRGLTGPSVDLYRGVAAERGRQEGAGR